MQIYSQLYQSQNTMFDAFLQQIGSAPLSLELDDSSIEYLKDDQQESIISQEKLEIEHFWALIDDPPDFQIINSKDSQGEQLSELEFIKIVSSREDQEDRVDKLLTCNRVFCSKKPALKKTCSNVLIADHCISPKKTKKIEKSKLAVDHRNFV